MEKITAARRILFMRLPEIRTEIITVAVRILFLKMRKTFLFTPITVRHILKQRTGRQFVREAEKRTISFFANEENAAVNRNDSIFIVIILKNFSKNFIKLLEFSLEYGII